MAMSCLGHKLPLSRWQGDPGGNKHMVGSICCAQQKNKYTIIEPVEQKRVGAANSGHLWQWIAGEVKLLGEGY